MSFDKLFKRSSAPALSSQERKQICVLVVEPESNLRNSLKSMVSALGYGGVSEAADHIQALKKFEERRITHVIFEAKRTSMPAKDFMTKVLEIDQTVVAIASSWEPNVDDVFSLLLFGARGYLVKPFTESGLDDAIVLATKGEPISEAILYAKNRNEALASLIMTALDKAATTIRQSIHFETAKREVPRRMVGLRRAIDIGRTFAEGGEELLLDSLVEFCLERANGPATRLGRLRKRLDSKKATHSEDGEPDDTAPETVEEGAVADGSEILPQT